MMQRIKILQMSIVVTALFLVLGTQTVYSHDAGATRGHDNSLAGHWGATVSHDPCTSFPNDSVVVVEGPFPPPPPEGRPGLLHFVDNDGDKEHDHDDTEITFCIPIEPPV